jgi:Cof subfamily protein (haloacid dehalogenase superfamily)
MVTSRKAIFLDVDGTLVNDFGRIPASAVSAVQEARANDHLVFLCTGRSVPELWPEILDIGFDGLIAGSGTFVQVGEDVLVDHHLDAPGLRHVIAFFDAHGVDYYFQTSDGIYGTPRLPAHLVQIIRDSVSDEDVLAELERGLFGFIEAIKVDADPFATRVTKVLYIDSSVPLEDVRAEFAGSFDVVPASVPMFGPNCGEMMIAGVHKATGIDVLIEHLGIDRADTIAIGDNYNDLEMLAHVQVGIAMGNAPSQVKDVADEVTAAVDQDGLALAFARHGLTGAAPGR